MTTVMAAPRPGGNVLTVTDALGHTTAMTYDPLGRVTSTTAADGGVTSTRYDALGRVVSVTDPMGATRIGFEGTTSINRQDYGVAFSAALETGGLLVSDKVGIEIEVAAVKNEVN